MYDFADSISGQNPMIKLNGEGMVLYLRSLGLAKKPSDDQLRGLRREGWKERLMLLGVPKLTVNDAQRDLKFQTKFPDSKAAGADLEHIIVESGGQNNAMLYLLYANGVNLRMGKPPPGLHDSKEILSSHFDTYMDQVSLGKHQALAWDKGNHKLSGGVGVAVVNQSSVFWVENGVIYSLFSENHTYKELLPVAKHISNKKQKNHKK